MSKETPEPHAPTGAQAAPSDATDAPIPGRSPQAGTPRQVNTLVWSMFIVWTVLSATYAGVIAVLLPDQIQQIDPAAKVANLAIVSTASSIATIFAQPIVGALSDRTRSRMGRRAPWMVIGAGAGAVCLLGLASATAIVWVSVFWVLAQVCLNALQGPLTAVMPDRVPHASRGYASGVFGVGQLVGMGLGVLVAGMLAHWMGIAYATFGAVVLICAVAFVLLNRDWSSAGMQRPPFSWAAFFRGFWISPRRHPDYGWAFAARFLMILAYQGIQTYLLYILRDHIGLDNDASIAMVFPLSATQLATAALTSVVGGRMSDARSRRKPFVIGASIVMAAALIIPLFAPSLPGMFAFAAVFGLGYGCYLAVDMALMSQVLPGGGVDAAKDMGILNVATNVPQALTPVVAWLLIDALNLGYGALFVSGMVFATLGALAVLPIRSVR